MLLTGHQPAYLPWLGYFEKIMRSDMYIFVDTVQFEHRSFINRNRVKTANGVVWLTVPVLSKGHRETTLLETKINNDIKWQYKHFMTICNAYKHAPYYRDIIRKISPFYEKKYELLSDFCFDFLLTWFKILKIDTSIRKLSDLKVGGRKSELVLNMCRSVNADAYLSGALGRDYMDEALFQKYGIEVIYQDYKPRTYPQLWGDGFIPCLSVLDFVMNTRDYTLIMGDK